MTARSARKKARAEGSGERKSVLDVEKGWTSTY